MEHHILYITARDKKEARRIAETLLSKRLAACANIIGNIQSLYWWDGKINDDREALLIAKTRATLVRKAVAAVRSVHSYQCPCIVSWPIKKGNPGFLAWIGRETRKKASPA